MGPELIGGCPDNAKKALERCYARWYHIIFKHVQWALIASGEKQSYQMLMKRGMWLFLVANCCHEQIQLILKLFLDPRVVPYERQYHMGQEKWTSETFATNGLVEMAMNHDMFANIWGVYRIRVSIPDVCFHYTGSSCDLSGLARRFISHEDHIARGLEELTLARARGSANVLFIHLLCAQPEAVYTIHEVARFPRILHPQRLVWLLKDLVHIFESSHIVFEGNLDARNYIDRKTKDKGSGKLANILFRRMRPTDMPNGPWQGANRSLPISQEIGKFAYKDGVAAGLYDKLAEVLRDHFLATKSHYLSAAACQIVIHAVESKFGMTLQHSRGGQLKPIKRWLRHRYRDMLRGLGVQPSDSASEKLRQFYPLLVSPQASF